MNVSFISEWSRLQISLRVFKKKKKMKCVFLSFFGVIGASVPLCVRAGHKSIKLAFHNSVFLKD